MDSPERLTQEDYSAMILESSKIEHVCAFEVKDISRFLWQNPTQKNSLRLSNYGFKMVTMLTTMEPFEIKITEKIKPKQLILLEKHFSGPYYIKNLNTIVVFGQDEIVALTLRDGNLHQYLDQFN